MSAAFEARCPGGCHSGGFADFDHYCDSAGIQPGEEPAAFAAWLNALSGWDGETREVEEPPEIFPGTHAALDSLTIRTATETPLPIKCPACGEHFGYGPDVPLLGIVQSTPFHEPAPCCGAWLTGTLHRDGTIEFAEQVSS